MRLTPRRNRQVELSIGFDTNSLPIYGLAGAVYSTSRMKVLHFVKDKSAESIEPIFERIRRHISQTYPNRDWINGRKE